MSIEISDNIIELLNEISLFHDFSSDEIDNLASFGEVKKINSKANIIIEGDLTRGFYILLQGTVSVYKNDPESGSMMRLTYLEKGAVFGELSLFDGASRSATIVAESFCRLFYLGAVEFEKFLEQHGDDLKVRFYRKCSLDMVERFRRQNSDYITSQQLLWKYALRKGKNSE